MKDSHERQIDYIRISVTDRCNLGCIYCRPDGVPSCESDRLLDREELLRLCRCFAGLGISKIKITGGEPLVRSDVSEIIASMKKIPGIENITLTTNGILLSGQISDLVKAGLDGVNISIDSLDEECYRKICGKNELKNVIEGIDAALKYPDLLVKVNCVPLKGINDDQLVQIALLAKSRNMHVRFIEIMPMGYGRGFACLTEDEVKRILQENLSETLIPYKHKLGNGPGHYYEIPGFTGKIGFISAVSHKFCGECNRIRLTCDGFLKACLQYNIGCDLRTMIKERASDAMLTEAMKATIYNKPKCHQFERKNEWEAAEAREERGMSQIGG